MIKDIDIDKDLKLYIVFTNGDFVSGDFPTDPFHVKGFISIWEKETLVAYPLSTIKKFYFRENT